MKRLLSVLLAVTLTLGLIPITAFAQIDSQDQEFQNFLQEIGMSEDEFLTYLEDIHDFTLADFDSVSELKDYLGPLVDESNLQDLLDEFELTKQELEDMLAENSTSLDEYIFYDDLYFDVYEFQYQEELTPITDESLQQLLDDYEFESKEELEKFLNKYDDSIENYENIEELEATVAVLVSQEGKDEIINILDKFGLSLDESKKLANYSMNIFEDPNTNVEDFYTKLEDIANRLMAFREFDSSDDLSADEIAEILDVWNDLLNLFELKMEFYLTKDGKTMPLLVESLLKMDSTNGADLKIKIFSKDGEFLADMVITAEMFGSDFLDETGENLKQTEQVAKEVSKVATKLPEKALKRTVKGGKLPNTASDYLPNALGGLAIAAAGIILFRRMKVKGI
ncbi:processed acidic surface protein [Bacillus sp. ISL-40]|uniref:processed acidic surface protein n=1 Tax=unclassified Bacillus (in: firmicutes) TaxID=185979 RepID=UPI001BE80FD3|nr:MULTISPECIES: processed acidic surface protein [unclassified Bacillus (in: firmicutes)]MBT2696791.1 processed acidic surface protein [Bacillus sp. ISL-40]MBT2740107.1 processed acidic surface protein [Bacillus sp. ISL-77]